MGATRKDIAPPDPGTLQGRLQLAMYLKDRKMNANKLALATGLSRQAIRLVLKGVTQKLLWETAVIYATELGVRPRWLQDGELPMYPAPELKDDEEIRLIDDFRHMSLSHQRDLAEIARRWAEEDGDDPSPRPFGRETKPPPRQ
jgi:transcriptional regulator with XRE-family HTH domain